MGKRGRPRHPDILTPREWEVLELVRDGLTNEQIAEQIGISRDGVKYHVSEILSKLGLGSREEAAAWRAERRPWWKAGVALLGWPLRQLSLPAVAKVVGAATLAAAAGGVGVLVWGVVVTGGPGDGNGELVPGLLSGLTLEEVYGRIEEAITRPGMVFHAKMAAEARDPGTETINLWTKEAWVDSERDVGRWELRLLEYDTDIAQRAVMVVSGDEAYYSDYDEAWMVSALVCEGTDSAVLSLIFECGGTLPSLEFDVPIAYRLEPDAEYDGRPAAALVFERTEVEETGGATTTYLYLERDTFLPIAWVVESFGRGEVGRFVSTYQNEFVAADALPVDFFDPVSIGYVEEDPESPLDDPALGLTVYWLGLEFDPGGGLPSLTLARSMGVRPPGGGPGDRAMLEYETLDGEAAVRLQLWRPEDWEAFLQMNRGRLLWDSSCVEASEISLEVGRAVIFMAHEPEGPQVPSVIVTAVPVGQPTPTPGPTPTPEPIPTPTPAGPCPNRPFDRFLAHVYFEDTVVAVNAPLGLELTGGFGPFDSLEGMEAVVEGLRAR